MTFNFNVFKNISLSVILTLMITLVLSVFKIDIVTVQTIQNVTIYIVAMFSVLYISLNLIKILMRKNINDNLIIIVSIATSAVLPIVLNNFLESILGYSGNWLGIVLVYAISVYIYFGSTISLIKKRDQ